MGMLGSDRGRDTGTARWGHQNSLVGMLGCDRDMRTAQWGHQGLAGTLGCDSDRSTGIALWGQWGHHVHRDSLM